MESKEIYNLKNIAAWVFRPVPPKVSRYYAKEVFGRHYSLENQFFNYCLKNSLIPVSEDRVVIQTLAWEVWERFIFDDSENFDVLDKEGNVYFDFSKFSLLFTNFP